MTNAPQTIEDFTLLLFFHMAHVDGSLHPNERDTILERMKELFPNDSMVSLKLLAMESQYPKIGDVKAEFLLLESMRSLSNIDSETKQSIYAALFDIINANGKVNTEETDALKVFRDWFQS